MLSGKAVNEVDAERNRATPAYEARSADKQLSADTRGGGPQFHIREKEREERDKERARESWALVIWICISV